MNRPLFLLAVPLLTVCVQAQADFYSHRYAGISYSDEDQSGFCSGATQFAQRLNNDQRAASIGNCPESGNSWKIYGGWRWTPHLAVEASFQKLAKRKFDFQLLELEPEIGDFPEWRERDRVSTRLGNLFLIGHWPLLEGMSLFGKIGGGAWSSSIKQNINATQLLELAVPEELQEDIGSETAILEVPLSGSFQETRTGFHWSYGAGISYRHQNSWTIRAEWENFAGIGSEDFFGGDDVETLSLGWSMHF